MRIESKKYYPRILSISGGGRNVGKTTLACELIKKFSKDYPVSTIKISSHFHQVNYLDPLKESQGKYMIYREEDPYLAKDSSKMLSMGAASSYYIQGKNDYITEAFHQCYDFIPSDHLIICESGRITQSIEPALAFYIENNQNNMKRLNSDDFICIERDTTYFKSILEKIHFDNERWLYKKDNENI